MKHRFLLDENILYFAILGIDERDVPDTTSTRLVGLIGANCHRIVVNRFLVDRYWSHIKEIMRGDKRPKAMEPVSFITQLLRNSEKLAFEHAQCPILPEDTIVPTEDIEIVQLALLAQTTLVSGDSELRDSVNKSPSLGLRAMAPSEALIPAADS